MGSRASTFMECARTRTHAHILPPIYVCVIFDKQGNLHMHFVESFPLFTESLPNRKQTFPWKKRTILDQLMKKKTCAILANSCQWRNVLKKK